jgi:hypothetical protein
MTSLTNVQLLQYGDDVSNPISTTLKPISDVPKLGDNASESRVRRNSPPADLTENASAGPTLTIVNIARSPQPALTPRANKIVANSVPGTVKRDLANGLILCEVIVESKTVDVTLPSYCFNCPFEYGTPFYLSMEDRGGYSTPVVTARDPEPLSESQRRIIDDVTGMFAS